MMREVENLKSKENEVQPVWKSRMCICWERHGAVVCNCRCHIDSGSFPENLRYEQSTGMGDALLENEMEKRYTMFAGSKYKVLRYESAMGIIPTLVIVDEHGDGHEDIVRAEDCDHVTDGDPCWCNPVRIVVGAAGHTDNKLSDTEENISCPVCGYYCLGKGGFGCIDKPTLVKKGFGE